MLAPPEPPRKRQKAKMQSIKRPKQMFFWLTCSSEIVAVLTPRIKVAIVHQ